jgi:glycosyltransferase involved in cell wall biosynthesis
MSASRSNIILLDNGLVSQGSHSYHISIEVCRELAERKLSYQLFAARSAELGVLQDLNAVPHFEHTLYDHVYELVELSWLGRKLKAFWSPRRPADTEGARPQPSEAKTYKDLNRSYELDLQVLPSEIWRRDNVVVVMAIMQNQLAGLISHMRRLKPEHRPLVICQLMFTPSWTPWTWPSEMGADFYRAAFKEAEGLIGDRLVFVTENQALKDQYAREYGICTEVLPIPLGSAHLHAVKQQTTGGPVQLGFLGYSKAEKGFHLLPAAIEICNQRGLPVFFNIQVQHGGWEQIVVEAEATLRKSERVRLIEGVLESYAYYKESEALDITLLPYDPIKFGLRGSGIFTESIVAGRPIVAAEGTWAARGIERGEAEGERFAPYTAGAFADAIERLVTNLETRKKVAQEKASVYAKVHGGAAFVDAVLAISQAHAK